MSALLLVLQQSRCRRIRNRRFDMYSNVVRVISVVFAILATIAFVVGEEDLALWVMLCAIYLLVLAVGEERSQ